MSISSSTTTYNTNSSGLLKGSIILCSHGICSSMNAFDKMLDYMENEYLFYKEYACTSLHNPQNNKRIYLTRDFNENDRQVLENQILKNRNKNMFIPVEFKLDILGFVSSQKKELSYYVDLIKKILTKKGINIPIILLGHSKGGLVGMNCALENEKVDKIISVGTPYDGTILDFILSVIKDSVLNIASKGKWIITKKILNIFDRATDKIMGELAQAILSEHVTDPLIIQKWKQRTRYIPCTLIGTEAIELNLLGNQYISDYIVPISSSCTDRLDVSQKFVINDKKISLTSSDLLSKFLNADSFINLRNFIARKLDGEDIAENDFEIILNYFKESLEQVGITFENSLDLAHCSLFGHDDYMLTDTTVCLRIVAGINAK